MFSKKVHLILVVAAIALAFEASTRAQSPVASRDDDPVAPARERIESAVEHRAAIAERVLAASKLLNESIAARKRGEAERAETQLQQAETIIAGITPSQQSYLLDEVERAIAAERAALNPAPSEKQRTLFTNAQLAQRLTRNVVARYGNYPNTLARILAEEQVPIELLAVAMVESGFNPLALSPKGARGIWQLMPATAERYGLDVEPTNDHRTHPEHSTRTAARYLRDLYRQFSDWKLALAAYNAGEDRIQRIINRTGIRDLDEMAHRGLLPFETRKYVPAVLVIWGQLSDNSAVSRLRKDE